jgi:hypothetical protein
LSTYATSAFPDEVPKRRYGKNVRRNKKSPSIKQANNCASARAVKGRLKKVDMVPVPALGCIVTLDSGTPPMIQQYHLTISQFPDYSCPYFKEMLTKAKGGRSQWAHCKHLYFVFTVICGFDANVDAFIHAPTLSFDEVKLILETGLLTHPTS